MIITRLWSHRPTKVNRVHLKHNGNIVIASLHLQHAPQAVMLVCRLEILTLHSSSEEPAHLIMQPQVWGSVQWCTGKWHLFGGSCERSSYMLFGWWISGLDLHKANFVLYQVRILLSKILFWRVEITPKYYIVASYVALGAIQQSWNLRHHHPSECMVLSSGLGFLDRF